MTQKEVDSLTITMDGKGHENVPLASYSYFIRASLLLLENLDPRKTLICASRTQKKAVLYR